MTTNVLAVLIGFGLFGLIAIATQLWGRDLDTSNPDKLKNKFEDASTIIDPPLAGGGDAGGGDAGGGD